MGIAKYYKDNLQVKRATITTGTSGAPSTVWNSILSVKGFLNESAGGKQFQIGQNIVISTGRAFIPITTAITALNITEKDRIYNSDSGKTFEILYFKKPNMSLSGKIYFYSIDVRCVV